MAVAEQVITDRYAIYNGDCMEVMPTLPDGSVHLSIYSPPFATSAGGLYRYSSSERDLSNSRDYAEFFEHYNFVVGEIFRLTMPGRMTAVHCMDVPSGNTGMDHRIDFPGDIVRLHTRCRKPKRSPEHPTGCSAHEMERQQGMCGHGWFAFAASYFVWKEPLAVRNRTMAKNLAHKTIVDDSSRCSNAAADEVLVFRRKGENPVPIPHPEGLLEYYGEREIPAELLSYRGWTGKQTENRYSHWIWRQYASSFWDDVRLGRVLPFQAARDAEDEKHVHPLQLDAIQRIITLWSNLGETVATPFMGVGSTVWSAVELGRRGLGVELKPSYFRQAKKNVATAGTSAPAQSSLLWTPAHEGEVHDGPLPVL